MGGNHKEVVFPVQHKEEPNKNIKAIREAAILDDECSIIRNFKTS